MNSKLSVLLNGDLRQFKRWSERRLNGYAYNILEKIIKNEELNSNNFEIHKINGSEKSLINIIRYVVSIDLNTDLSELKLYSCDTLIFNECIQIIQKLRGNKAAIKYYYLAENNFSDLQYVNHELISAISFYGKDWATTRYALKKMAILKPKSIDIIKKIALLEASTRNFELASKAYSFWYKTDPNDIDALIGMVHSAKHECFFGLSKFEEKISEKIEIEKCRAETLFALLSNKYMSRKLLRIAHERYAHNRFKEYKIKPQNELERNNSKINIGYLSADFYTHATLMLAYDAITKYNKNTYNVHIFDYSSKSDELTEKLKANVDYYHNILDLSSQESANYIAAKKIDILIDIKGYTTNTRLDILAYRPALIQVAWLAYPSTYGSKLLVDYVLADEQVVPLGNEDEFIESVYKLKCCYQPNTLIRENIAYRRKRIFSGKLCNFNQFYKMGEEWIEKFGKFLSQNSKITITFLSHSEAANNRLAKSLISFGANISQIFFREGMKPEEHLQDLLNYDLAIDSFPYTSHTTGSDALWTGMPLIPAVGDTFASRVSYSLYYHAGLPLNYVGEGIDGMINHLQIVINDNKYYQILIDKLILPETLPLFNSDMFTTELDKFFKFCLNSDTQ